MNHRPKTTKYLEEGINVNLYDIRLGNGFLNISPKTQVTKEK